MTRASTLTVFRWREGSLEQREVVALVGIRLFIHLFVYEVLLGRPPPGMKRNRNAYPFSVGMALFFWYLLMNIYEGSKAMSIIRYRDWT